MNFKFNKKIILSLVLSAFVLGNTNIAHAESVVWTTPNPVFVFTNTSSVPGERVFENYTKGKVPGSINNVIATIKYNTRVMNLDTGEVVACGSSVPAGTKLKFEFIPHQTEDVSWFGTGGTYDSPYGSWKVGGAAPSDLCVTKNYLKEELTQSLGLVKIYTDLAVQPPIKSIRDLPSSCTNVGTDKECLMDTVGRFNPIFQWSSTYGVFHYGISNSGGGSWSRGNLESANSCLKNSTPSVVTDSSNVDIISSWKILNFISASAELPFNFRGYRFSGSALNLFEFLPVAYRTLVAEWSKVASHIPVAPQQISCPITVTPTDAIPGVLLDAPGVSKGGSCIVTQAGKGVLYKIKSPETGRNIKFLIDWNNDGTTDQILPPSGYTNAASLDATRIWGDIGMKTFSVVVQDESGMYSSNTVFTSTTDCELPLDPLEEEPVEEEVIVEEEPDEIAKELVKGGIPPILTNRKCILDISTITDVTSCTLKKEGQGSSTAIDISVPFELDAGRYKVSCRSFEGQLLASDFVCLLTPDVREI